MRRITDQTFGGGYRKIVGPDIGISLDKRNSHTGHRHLALNLQQIPRHVILMAVQIPRKLLLIVRFESLVYNTCLTCFPFER